MLNTIRKALLEYVEIEEESITEDTEILQDLHMNSYDFVTMVGELEEKFGIEIPDEELREIVTVGDVIKCIKSKMNE